MDLINLAKSFLDDNAIDTIAQNNNIEKNQAQDATSSILDLLLGGLAKNASTKEGADKLDKALSEDHDGSILDQLIPFLQGQQPQGVADTTANGSGIITHILGDKVDQAAELISKKTGVSEDTIKSLLPKLAPVALGLLGKFKKETNSDATSIAETLKKTAKKEQEGSNGFMDTVGKFLDQNGDGSYMDDLLNMAQKFIK